ncbi:MAG: hypothetical protein L7V86_15685 [Verrucomicrobiales bacterium]|nr:hypothetical protein [Verrucomicrobiales bacterium]
MNEDRELIRLIEIANKGADKAPPMAASFPSEVIRKAWPQEDESQVRYWLAGVRWGAIGAAAIMVACILLNVRTLQSAHITSEAVFQKQITEMVFTQ